MMREMKTTQLASVALAGLLVVGAQGVVQAAPLNDVQSDQAATNHHKRMHAQHQAMQQNSARGNKERGQLARSTGERKHMAGYQNEGRLRGPTNAAQARYGERYDRERMVREGRERIAPGQVTGQQVTGEQVTGQQAQGQTEFTQNYGGPGYPASDRFAANYGTVTGPAWAPTNGPVRVSRGYYASPAWYGYYPGGEAYYGYYGGAPNPVGAAVGGALDVANAATLGVLGGPYYPGYGYYGYPGYPY